ncbi:MAG: hypothetical protein AABX74_02545, partial [Nanoarchaeota archaeon]
MKEPLRFFNDERELLLELQGVHGGSVKYPQQMFNCSKCFKDFFVPYACERHNSKCSVPITNVIFKGEDVLISKIKDKTNKKLINALCELAYFSKREQRVDFVLTNSRENFNETHPVYALFKSQKLIGYMAYGKQKLIDKNGESFFPWVLLDMYVIRTHRRKGY